MTRKQRRGVLIGASVAVLTLATLLVLFGLSNRIDVFRTPTALASKPVPAGTDFRLGGLVETGSVHRGPGAVVNFAVTDGNARLPVRYVGILPDLFREGQGIVAQGKLDAQGTFVAATVLAKHDETYMPPEVAKALKEQGVWQEPPRKR
jgi:cytochrome c-type biogenesis protein CcmE